MASSIDVTLYDDSTLMLKVVHLLEDAYKRITSKTIYLPISSKSIQFISQHAHNVLSLLIDCKNSPFTQTEYEIIMEGSTDNQSGLLNSVNMGTVGRVVLTQGKSSPLYSATVLVRFKNGIKFNKRLSLFSRLIVGSGIPTESPDDYYDKGIGLDVSIIINKNIIKASTYVLGLHSPVFKAMFENDWKDSRENLIEINDIEYDVMLLFVKSLHCVPVQLDNVNVAFQLYIVANKYNVNDIKQQVQRYVKEGINKDTAVNILTLAHNLNIEDIKRDALNFMTSFQYGKIEELQGYNQMSVEIALLILNETRNRELSMAAIRGMCAPAAYL